MKASGSSVQKLDKGKALKLGQMAQSTQDGGETTKQTEMVDSFTLTETFTMEHGMTIKLTASELTLIKTGPST